MLITCGGGGGDLRVKINSFCHFFTDYVESSCLTSLIMTLASAH